MDVPEAAVEGVHRVLPRLFVSIFREVVEYVDAQSTQKIVVEDIDALLAEKLAVEDVERPSSEGLARERRYFEELARKRLRKHSSHLRLRRNSMKLTRRSSSGDENLCIWWIPEI